MKIVRGFGKLIKPFVNVPGWMGWKQITAGGQTIKGAAQVLIDDSKSRKEKGRKETFEQAKARFHLSENDIRQRMYQFRKMAFFYCVIALGLAVYAVFLFTQVYINAGILSLILTVLALTLAFRQHFWYFQMKKRKLGCTVKEWFNGTFRGGR